MQSLTSAPSLLSINSPPGAGMTTWLRQWSLKSGVDALAVDVIVSSAESSSVSALANRLAARALLNQERQITTLWLIDDANRSTIRQLRSFCADSDAKGLKITLSHRMAMRSDLDWRLPTTVELGECLRAAIKHVGRQKAIMDEAAIETIARLSNRRYDHLASLTHQILSWAAGRNIQLIERWAVNDYFDQLVTAPLNQQRAA